MNPINSVMMGHEDTFYDHFIARCHPSQQEINRELQARSGSNLKSGSLPLPHIFCDTWHVWQGTWLREAWRRSLLMVHQWQSIYLYDVTRPYPGVSPHLASVAWHQHWSQHARGGAWHSDILTCVDMDCVLRYNVYFYSKSFFKHQIIGTKLWYWY